MLLSELYDFNKSTSLSDVRQNILIRTKGKLRDDLQSFRNNFRKNLERDAIVSSSGEGTSANPFLWSLDSRFYGQLAKQALSFTSDVQLPIHYFTGKSSSSTKSHAFAKAHTLYLAESGILCDISVDRFKEIDFLGINAVYGLLDEGLLLREGRTYYPSDLGSKFVSKIYHPILEFTTGARQTISHGVKLTDEIGVLYLEAERLHTDFVRPKDRGKNE